MAYENALPTRRNDAAFGCIFCSCGKEMHVAGALEQRLPQIRARAVRQTKRRTCKGFTTLHDEVILHGYVLFEAPEDLPVLEAIPKEDIIAILTDTDGDWRLFGRDEDYARWVFRHDGLLGLSRAYRVGDRIQIIDGPLKDMEGQITRIDRRNRGGQVTLSFGGQTMKVWLGFDIVEEYGIG